MNHPGTAENLTWGSSVTATDATAPETTPAALEAEDDKFFLQLFLRLPHQSAIRAAAAQPTGRTRGVPGEVWVGGVSLVAVVLASWTGIVSLLKGRPLPPYDPTVAIGALAFIGAAWVALYTRRQLEVSRQQLDVPFQILLQQRTEEINDRRWVRAGIGAAVIMECQRLDGLLEPYERGRGTPRRGRISRPLLEQAVLRGDLFTPEVLRQVALILGEFEDMERQMDRWLEHQPRMTGRSEVMRGVAEEARREVTVIARSLRSRLNFVNVLIRLRLGD